MRSGLVRIALVAPFSVLVACPAAVDRAGTLQRLRAALEQEVTGNDVLEEQNRLVEDASRSGALEGMFQHELAEALGRGTGCGVNSLCARHHFRPTDWIYELGRTPGDPDLPAGPTLIVGFDSTGRVERTFSLTRRRPAPAR